MRDGSACVADWDAGWMLRAVFSCAPKGIRVHSPQSTVRAPTAGWRLGVARYMLQRSHIESCCTLHKGCKLSKAPTFIGRSLLTFCFAHKCCIGCSISWFAIMFSDLSSNFVSQARPCNGNGSLVGGISEVHSWRFCLNLGQYFLAQYLVRSLRALRLGCGSVLFVTARLMPRTTSSSYASSHCPLFDFSLCPDPNAEQLVGWLGWEVEGFSD